jgi:hypothetical protein
LKKFVLAALCCGALYAQGNIYMGQTYYAYFLAPNHGIGSEFTKLHTKQEWERLFADNARGFYEKFAIKAGTFDDTALKHLESFMIYYAKDSEAKAVCN